MIPGSRETTPTQAPLLLPSPADPSRDQKPQSRVPCHAPVLFATHFSQALASVTPFLCAGRHSVSSGLQVNVSEVTFPPLQPWLCPRPQGQRDHEDMLQTRPDPETFKLGRSGLFTPPSPVPFCLGGAGVNPIMPHRSWSVGDSHVSGQESPPQACSLHAG